MFSSIQYYKEMLIPFAVFAGILAGVLVLRRIVFAYLLKQSKKTTTKIDDVVIAAIKLPTVLWSLLAALYFTLYFQSLPKNVVLFANKSIFIIFVISIVMVISEIAGNAISTVDTKKGHIPDFVNTIIKSVLYIFGLLIIFNSMGIAITPMLATLGVGGIAVALALQDTLANLFAGFYLVMAKQIRINDYIRLESGQEGYVTDINWRVTKVRMLSNNVVIVPNERLTKAIIINFQMPVSEMSVLVEVGVHYDSNLEFVEKIVVDTAKETMKEVSGAVKGFEPFIRYHTFADYSINFSVILRANEFVDQYLIKHDFIKRLHSRFKKENIVIPYPIRTLEIKKGDKDQLCK